MITNEKNTWCSGCFNFVLFSFFNKALDELQAEGKIDIKKTVIVTDIGCGSKIYDYINMNGFCSLHGRAIPTATGIKAANPEMTVIAFGGDGGTYNEGMNHVVHASRRNADIVTIVGNNRVFALTKGQQTATTPSEESHFEPLAVAAAAQASFLARETVFDQQNLLSSLKKAITHKGFSLIEVLEPCAIFMNDKEALMASIKRIPEGLAPEEAKRFLMESLGYPTGIFVEENRSIF